MQLGMIKKPARKLSVSAHTVRLLHADHLGAAAGGYLARTTGCGGGGNMFPYSNAYPTQCLAGTGCGNMSGACA